MDLQTSKQNKNITGIIIVISILLPVFFFGAIKLFKLSGLPLYFAQLGIYTGFFLLAFWGIKQDQIRLPFNWRKVLETLAILLASWLIYALIISGTGIIHLPEELETL